MLDAGIGPLGYHRQYYLDRDWHAYTDILARIVRHSLPGPILDLGAGCGYLVEAASLWGMKCVGLEGSAEAIELAKLRTPDLDIRVHRLSSELPSANESFQTVVLNQVIEHLEAGTARHTVQESLRVLRPGGMLMILAPSKANRSEASADPTHINMMSPRELRDLLVDCGFERVTSLDVPLPLLGTSRLSRGLMALLFKLIPLDQLSATSNAIAFKPHGAECEPRPFTNDHAVGAASVAGSPNGPVSTLHLRYSAFC